MPTIHKKTLFQRLDSTFTTTPIVKHGPDIFTVRDYMRAVGISEMTAYRRVHELMSKGEVRRVKVRTERGLQAAYEFLGRD